ncbi:MAG: hypothetical protein II453_01770 [Alphaproteobacteria bacterium]|nr:hypothetical protein [Alphaproteobacteria bacterium]
MAEYITRDSVETVTLNSPIPFGDSIPCKKGYVIHNNNTGIFVLRGITQNCFARYNVEFTGNIAIPEGGAVTPIATAIVVSGEERTGSKSIFTPAAVDEYGNVTSRATVDVPRGCCFTVAVEYVNGTVNDPTVAPTPIINVIDGSLSITRTA